MAAEPGSWTPQQRQAIELRGMNLLISAAAGAGKTAVLVERVVRRLADPERPLDADRLLLVTFTEAAAAEMRERVTRALEREAAARPDDARLRRQLVLLGRAAISTIHSFCLSLIRRHFHLLHVDPSCRVLGEGEARLLEAEVLDALLERRYAAGDATFLELVDRYGGRADEALRRAVLHLYALARSLPRPRAWLEGLKRGFSLPEGVALAATPWLRPLADRCRRVLARAAMELEEALALAEAPAGPTAYLPQLAAELSAVRAAAERVPADWGALAATVGEAVAAFGRLPAARGGGVDPGAREEVRRLRESARRTLTGLYRWLRRPEPDLLAELRALRPLAEALVDLVLAFDQAYSEAKLQRGVLDFGDLEHLALGLLSDPARPGELVPSEVALGLRARFEEVLVDEYQDVSPVQDAILQLVARDGGPGGPPNLVLVGDVKQSIYGFRLAEPGLFLGRYRRYPPGGGGPERRVDLSHNFRSRRPVVDAVNFLFRQLLTPALGGLAYGPDAELVCAATYPDPPAGVVAGDAPVEVYLLEREGPAGPGDDLEAEADARDREALEREALLAARLIRRWVQGGDGGPPLHVWDPELGAYRRARFGDVAVLLRAPRGRSQAFAAVLAREGIPVYAEGGSGYLDAFEVRLMLALLQVIDNPRQDIPLAAVLRSPLVGLSDADLARVRLGCPRGDLYAAVRAALRQPARGLAEAAAAGEPGHGAPVPAAGTRLAAEAAERLAAFLARLEAWRTAARRGPLPVLIDRIYRDTGFVDFVAALPGGARRQANLLGLYERARQFDRSGRQGLLGFLRFLERLRELEEDLAPPPVAVPGEDAVRVLSIHRSKGLEFPAVIVADLGRDWNRQDLEGDVLCHRELGLGLRVVDLERRVKYPSLAHRAVAERLREEGLAEEMRLLYVALTRARERLVLIGSLPDLERRLVRWARAARRTGWPLPEGLLAAASCFLDWVGPALARHRDGAALRPGMGDPADAGVAADPSRWQIRLRPAGGRPQGPDGGGAVGPAPHAGGEAAQGSGQAGDRHAAGAGGARDAGAPPDRGGAPAGGDWIAALARRLAWTYPWRPLCRRFAKRAVSELKGRLDPARLEEPLPADLRLLVPGRPRFARPPAAAPTPAERGTATHRLLQHLDLSRPLDAAGVRRQALELVARELLTPEEAEWADCEAVARFFATPLGRRIAAQPGRVRRELAFTMGVPAREVYPDLPPGVAEGERVVIQGTIDLLLEEGERLVLVDFKTDRPGGRSVEELADPYRSQMDMYRRAVAAVYGHPPDEAYLVFLTPGVAVPV